MKKYELTEEAKQINLGYRVVTLHRIRATKSFVSVEIGDLGGYVEKEENLSHEGMAWIYGDAEVCGNASVFGNASVSGNASVYGDARVSGNAIVYGDARVCEDAEVYGNARVYGDASVYGDARVCGNASVFGNAEVYCTDNVLVIGPIGSRNGYTTFYRDKDNEIAVKCGCFSGKIDSFLEKVEQQYNEEKHGAVYKAAANLAKLQISLNEEEVE